MFAFRSTGEAKKQKLDEEPEQDFSAPWHFSDVVLVVEERKFHVHRSILSIWSPVFETMFTSEFKEKTSPEIPLPGKKASEIDALLKLIYSKQERRVDEENFEFLLDLAKEYQVKEVTDLCLKFMESVLKRETALHLYTVAFKHNFENFEKLCMEQIKLLKMEFIEKHEHFLEFSVEDRLEIVLQMARNLESNLRSNNHQNAINERLRVGHPFKSCKKCQANKKSNESFYTSW